MRLPVFYLAERHPQRPWVLLREYHADPDNGWWYCGMFASKRSAVVHCSLRKPPTPHEMRAAAAWVGG